MINYPIILRENKGIIRERIDIINKSQFECDGENNFVVDISIKTKTLSIKRIFIE